MTEIKKPVPIKRVKKINCALFMNMYGCFEDQL